MTANGTATAIVTISGPHMWIRTMSMTTSEPKREGPPPPTVPNFREDERLAARYKSMLERRIKDFASEHDSSVRRNASAKRDELREELEEANAEWARRNEVLETAREAYRKSYPDHVKKTRLVEPSAIENMRSLGAANKLYKAAQDAWRATENAASNIRRIEHNEPQVDVELQKALERVPEVVKEVTTSEKWLAEIHADEEMASVKAKVEEINAEREVYSERLAAGRVSNEELRLRTFAEGDVKKFQMPVAGIMFHRIDQFGPDAYFIFRDTRKQLSALPYDRRLENLLDGVYDFTRTGKEFELRKSLQPNSPMPLSQLEYFKKCTANDEEAQEAYRQHQEFAREKRMLATTPVNEFDEMEVTAIELFAKFAAEKAQ
jgi:hypothetical protein